MADPTPPPRVVVDCHTAAALIDAALYCPAHTGRPEDDMRLFRAPGNARTFLGRLRHMREPMPAERRLALCIEGNRR